ncbi:hypothetical protein WJX84_008279 [Apatococcus fuscideae]|uniref:Tr-type G domain-containing protein n=1 Tax=Apatococcus fuscideae TaxID=2026836 RepID=A0AAW1TEZ0_9CHLO
MLGVDIDELDLGSRRKPVEWVIVAPPQSNGKSQQGERTQGSRRTGGRRNAAARARRKAAQEAVQAENEFGSSCNYQPVLSNGKQRDDPGMFDETSIPGWTRDNEGAPSVFEEDLLVPKRRLTHAQASMSASAALPGFNDLGLIESGQLGLGSTHSGFSPLSANSGSQTFALGPPGNGSSSPFHPFDVVRQMSSCRASADSDKAQRSTGSQAFGEGSGELDDGVGDGMDYIAAEDDDGNVEYKLRLKNPSPVRFQQLVTQLKFRLSEGSGECYYYLGVQDDGKLLLQQLPVGQHRAALYMRVRRASVDHLTCADLCVAVAGAVDSGKSTLVAALTHGCEGRPRLDDGQGAARMAVLRHKHEIESGRTSSISQQLLGYDDEGRVLNYAGVAALTAAEIGVSARKVVHFLDLGGHAKFLKTALYGLTCLRPDYMLLCVEMGLGLEPAAREHLAVALAMRIPVALLLTKADLAQPGQLASSLDGLRETIVAAAAAAASGGIVNANGPGAEQCAPFLDTEAKARALAAEWSSLCPQHAAGKSMSLVVPIFPLSCKPAVTPSPANPSRVIFQVDNTFEVRGVGSVVSGMVLCGQICVGAQLLMGPTEAAAFTLVNVTCIQRCQVSVGKLEAGERATLAIHSIADADQGAANNTPEPVSSLETRAVWRPCIPDNPYDHPLIVPSSSQESPATSPLPGSRSKSSLQQALCNNFSSEAYQIHDGAGTVPLKQQPPERSASPAAPSTLSPPKPRQDSTGEMEWLPGGEGISFEDGADHLQRVQSPVPETSASCPLNPPRKGAVLIDADAEPRVAWEFEAILVLLSGHWPARGLLSGHGPPSTGLMVPLLWGPGTMIAAVTALEGAAGMINLEPCGLLVGHPSAVPQRGMAMPQSCIAAAPNRSRPRFTSGPVPLTQDLQGADDEASKEAQDIGCVVRVTLRFLHHPEWLQVGFCCPA